MKKISGLLVAALASLFTLFLVAPSAQAYPETPIVISVSSHNVTSGQTITFSAKSPVPCSWTARFNRATRRGSGVTFSGSFTAPTVRHTHVFVLTITCRTGSAAARAVAGAASSAPGQTITRSVRITVHPSGSQGGPSSTSGTAGTSAGTGALPNTGGPSSLLLGGAAALIVAGAASVAYNRRRQQA